MTDMPRDPTTSLRTAADASRAAFDLAPRLMEAAPQTDVEGAFPEAAVRWLHETGLLSATLPVALGGTMQPGAADLLELLRLLKHVGRGNLAVGRLYEGHVNALQLITLFGSAAQQDRAASDAVAGHLFGVWNTQAQDGLKLGPAADAPGRGLLLTGSKTFASGAGQVSRALITADRWDGGWQMIVLPTDQRRPRYDDSFWKPLGMRATASFRADFTGLEVEPGDLLGEPGAYYRAPWFGGGAIRFAAVQLGGAEAIFDETRRFLAAMGRVDDPYQRVRLGEMALLIEGGNLWLEGAARQSSDHGDLERVVAHANMVRSAVEDICIRTMQLAERCVGARGLLRPSPFERLHRDLTHYLRQPAPDAALADVGRHVLARSEPADRLWAR
jgi:alkylation response protein AidB-like acyl-CoA dehydrogenase